MSSSRSSPSSSASSGWSSTRAPSPPPQRVTGDPQPGRAVRPARRRERPRAARVVPRRSRGRSRTNARSRPAAEWLVDNFPIVDEQLREIRDDLPPDYYRELPEAGRRPPRGLPAGARPRVGLHRPHRQPVRSREPAADGPRLPGGRAADDRRALGDRDQPAHPARREPPPAGRADRPQPRRPPGRGRARRRPARARRRTIRATPRPRCAGCRARGSPTAGSRPALPAAARPGPGGDPGAALARGAARRAGHDRRGDWSASSTSARRR